MVAPSECRDDMWSGLDATVCCFHLQRVATDDRSQETTTVGCRNEDSEAIVALSFLYIVCDNRSSNSKSRKWLVVDC